MPPSPHTGECSLAGKYWVVIPERKVQFLPLPHWEGSSIGRAPDSKSEGWGIVASLSRFFLLCLKINLLKKLVLFAGTKPKTTSARIAAFVSIVQLNDGIKLFSGFNG